MARKKNTNSYDQILGIWYRCPVCRISQSFGPIEYEGLKPKCPGCSQVMVKEVNA